MLYFQKPLLFCYFCRLGRQFLSNTPFLRAAAPPAANAASDHAFSYFKFSTFS